MLVGLDVILQCLPQNSTTGEVKWFNITCNNEGKQNKNEEMEEHSAWLLFCNVNKAHTGTYVCRMKRTDTMFRNRHSVQNPSERNGPTRPQRNKGEGQKEKNQKGKRGGTLLRRWEVTAAPKFRSDSEIPQSEHEGMGWGLLRFLCFCRADHFPIAHLSIPPHAP